MAEEESQTVQRMSRDRLVAELHQRTVEAEQRSARLREFAADLTYADPRERRHLAGLMHNHLQQLLASAKMHLGLLRRENSDEVAKIRQLLAESIEASRSLTVELSPPMLYEAGLAAALGWLGWWMGEKFDLKVHTHGDPEAQPQDDDGLALVFSTVRELLFNLAKHAPSSEAWVTLDREDDTVRIRVEETGSGGDPDQPNPLHLASYGLDHLRERLKNIGGGLRIDSIPGQGARATLFAPLKMANQTPQAIGPEDTNPANPETPAEAAEAQETGAGPPAPSPESEPDAGPEDLQIRLLLVDDQEVVRKALAMMFEYEPDLSIIAQAADGKEAIELARQHRPDMVMMDVNMPGMGGIEATDRIRQQMPAIPVIGLSMHNQPEIAAAMSRAGACTYFAKDAPSADLLAAIREHAWPSTPKSSESHE